MSFYLTAILLGLGFASLALGIFISMRIFNIPDITTDGSFTLGGAVTAVMLVQHVSLPVIFLSAFLAGSIAGARGRGRSRCDWLVVADVQVRPTLRDKGRALVLRRELASIEGTDQAVTGIVLCDGGWK